MIKEVKLPNGQTATIQVAAIQPGCCGPVVTVKAIPQRKPCVHLGASVNAIKPGCAGVQQNAPWTCELHGQCLPAIKHDLNLQIKACGLCEDYQEDSGPSLLRKAANFATAVVRWEMAGKPVRSAERVAELFTICNGCQYLKRDRGRTKCAKCGCPVNLEADAKKNKLAMGTEACPIGLWQAETTI